MAAAKLVDRLGQARHVPVQSQDGERPRTGSIAHSPMGACRRCGC